MARFIQPQQQSVVQMYTPKNIEFYANILNKAQSDLERATAMKAAAIEKYGDLNMYSKQDRDLTIGKVQDRLSGVLDADFVSPSKVANAVMQANQEVMPYVQALKVKDKEAQLQNQLKNQWGTDFIGNDVANMSIADASGQAVDPSSIRGINYNAEQFRKMFHESYGANLLNKIEGSLKSSGKAGILTRETVKGLSEQAKNDLLFPGRPEAIRLATQNFESMPETTQKDLVAIYGSIENALDYLQQENYKSAFDPKYNMEKTFQDMSDPNWEFKMRKAMQRTEETRQRNARIQQSLTVDQQYITKAKKLSNMSRSLLGKSTTDDNLLGRVTGWAVRNVPGFNYTFGAVDKALEFVGGNLYTNPEEFNSEINAELPSLIRNNKKLYNQSSKVFSANKEIQRAFGVTDKSSQEEIVNSANAFFLENLASETQSMAGMQQNLYTYSPTEVPNVMPDVLSWVSNGNSVLDLTTGKDTKISDFEKFKESFNDASIHFNPSENRIELSSNTDKTKVAVSLAKLDAVTNEFTSFASKVVKLKDGEEATTLIPRTVVLPDGKPTVAYVKVKRVGGVYIESYLSYPNKKPLKKDSKDIVGYTNPDVFVDEAVTQFEETYLKQSK